MATIADLFTKYNCTNCQDDIQGIRVHCAECDNFDLCLQVSGKIYYLFAIGLFRLLFLSQNPQIRWILTQINRPADNFYKYQ